MKYGPTQQKKPTVSLGRNTTSSSGLRGRVRRAATGGNDAGAEIDPTALEGPAPALENSSYPVDTWLA